MKTTPIIPPCTNINKYEMFARLSGMRHEQGFYYSIDGDNALIILAENEQVNADSIALREIAKLTGKITVRGITNTNFSFCIRDVDVYYLCKELDISEAQFTNLTDATQMFSSFINITELDVSHLDTSKVGSMYGMFLSCSSLKKLDLSNFDTRNCEDMSHMFALCTNLKELNIDNFDTHNCKYMTNIFSECPNLVKESLISMLDVSSCVINNDWLY